MTKADEPKNRLNDGSDTFGPGMNADGTVNVVSPEEFAQQIAYRNAYEAEDEEPDGDQEDDLSDLDDLDAVFDEDEQ